MSQWSLKGNKLRGMSALMIVDGQAPGPKRDEFIVGWMDRIVNDRRYNSFNTIRIFINNEEVLTTTLFEEARKRGLSIGADSIDTEYKQSATLYPKFIDDLYKKGVRVFFIDDANRYTQEQITAMAKPIFTKRDTALILSTAVYKSQMYIEMGRAIASALRFAATRIGVEPQMYRHGESTGWVATWFKSYPLISMAALEVYKPDGQAMTSLRDLQTMGSYFVDNKPANLSVYAAYDENTDLSKLPDHWDAVLETVDRWNAALGI
jgi:hypothetical protein